MTIKTSLKIYMSLKTLKNIKLLKIQIYNFTFPHEKIYKNDKTSIKFFKNRYEQRIANFDRYCKQENI